MAFRRSDEGNPSGGSAECTRKDKSTGGRLLDLDVGDPAVTVSLSSFLLGLPFRPRTDRIQSTSPFKQLEHAFELDSGGRLQRRCLDLHLSHLPSFSSGWLTACFFLLLLKGEGPASSSWSLTSSSPWLLLSLELFLWALDLLFLSSRC